MNFKGYAFAFPHPTEGLQIIHIDRDKAAPFCSILYSWFATDLPRLNSIEPEIFNQALAEIAAAIKTDFPPLKSVGELPPFMDTLILAQPKLMSLESDPGDWRTFYTKLAWRTLLDLSLVTTVTWMFKEPDGFSARKYKNLDRAISSLLEAKIQLRLMAKKPDFFSWNDPHNTSKPLPSDEALVKFIYDTEIGTEDFISDLVNDLRYRFGSLTQ